MQTNYFDIGVDVGNYDTKSPKTNTPSGYVESDKPPFTGDDYLEYNGKYYVQDLTRFPYVQDKTKNKNCLILSLFAIAKEIDLAVSKRKCPNGMQEEISDIKVLNLGVGLPPTHCASLSKPLLAYYQDNFKDGIHFIYKGNHYDMTLGTCRVYPQDFAAVVSYTPKIREDSVISYGSYYGIDIGGYTVDVITIIDKKIQMSQCDSRPLGVLKMYERMIRSIEEDTSIRLTPDIIESVLKKEKTIVRPDIIKKINDIAKDWYREIMNSLKQFGLSFDTYPVLFIGGGAQLFKSLIKSDSSIAKYEFIPGSNSNAKGYKALLANELSHRN